MTPVRAIGCWGSARHAEALGHADDNYPSPSANVKRGGDPCSLHSLGSICRCIQAEYHSPVNIEPSQLTIITYPHPGLRHRADPIDDVTDEVRTVAHRMIELMHEAEGVGLAAPQINIPWRLFVTNSRQDGDMDRVYVNPILRDPGGSFEIREEGCLSLPEIAGEVRRPSQITIDAIDLEGNPFSMTEEGYLARIWQHEFDHLNGVLIIDRFTPMAKRANRRIVKALEESAGV